MKTCRAPLERPQRGLLSAEPGFTPGDAETRGGAERGRGVQARRSAWAAAPGRVQIDEDL